MNEIKELYNQIEDKKALIKRCCKEFGGKEMSYATNWFSRYYSVPDRKRDRLIVLMNRQIKREEKKSNKNQ